MWDYLINGIETKGYVIIDNAFDDDLLKALLKDSQSKQNHFVSAKIGRNEKHHASNKVRQDKTLWLDGSNEPQKQLLLKLDEIQASLNKHFYLGLNYLECHYALYKDGAFYKKHFDAFSGQSNRKISLILYLNSVNKGGELVIYGKGSKEIERIKPRLGKLVLFESEQFEHEVLPVQDERYSIAGWFRSE